MAFGEIWLHVPCPAPKPSAAPYKSPAARPPPAAAAREHPPPEALGPIPQLVQDTNCSAAAYMGTCCIHGLVT